MKRLILLFMLALSANLFAAVEDFNFGIVINNSKYHIYRSSSLGTQGIDDVWNYLKKNNLPTPKTIIYMNDEGYKSRFLSEDFALQEYALQEKYGFKMFHSFDYKYRTYLDGHDPFNPTEDIDLKDNLNSAALKLFGPNPKDGIDGGVDALNRILDLVLDPASQPVLIHCMGGKHRTGMVAMIVRYLESDKASDVIGTDSVLKSRAEVEYGKYTGRSSVRSENVDFVRKYIKSEKFIDYKNKFRIDLSSK